jgi:hypothetical protein
MTETSLIYILPSVGILGFCVASCFCARFIRRRAKNQYHAQTPYYVPYTIPQAPNQIPIISTPATAPVIVHPSAPSVSSDSIQYPYASAPPVETYVPHPAYYTNTHYVVTTVHPEQRIQWSNPNPVV